jgi:hypothetical protein
LQQNGSGVPPISLSQRDSSMVVGDDRHHVFRRCQFEGSVQRVLKQGPLPDERTVLFGFVLAQPPLDQRPHPLSFTASQNDGPEMAIDSWLVHRPLT